VGEDGHCWSARLQPRTGVLRRASSERSGTLHRPPPAVSYTCPNDWEGRQRILPADRQLPTTVLRRPRTFPSRTGSWRRGICLVSPSPARPGERPERGPSVDFYADGLDVTSICPNWRWTIRIRGGTGLRANGSRTVVTRWRAGKRLARLRGRLEEMPAIVRCVCIRLLRRSRRTSFGLDGSCWGWALLFEQRGGRAIIPVQTHGR